MEQSSLWIAVASVFLLGLLMKLLDQSFLISGSKQQWPPGPTRFPLIGNLYQLSRGGELVHLTLAKMAQKHGRIMTVWFGGPEPTIVLSDHELAWEVLVTKVSDYSSRTRNVMSKITSADWNTLATSSLGPAWERFRKGLQSTTLHPRIIFSHAQLQEKDIADLTSSLEQEASLNNGIVKPLLKLRKLAIRLAGRLCFGPESSMDDLFAEGIYCAIVEAIKLEEKGHLVDVFEFTRYIPGLKPPFKELESLKQRVKVLISSYISTHKPSSSNCYLSFLLSQGFTEDIVIANLFELFMFSVDSTSNTIAWALAFVIHHEDIQQRVLTRVMNKLGGMRRMVSVADLKTEMEYVHAVVKETVRSRPIVPWGLPRRATRDSELKGMTVREGTQVLVNLYAVLHDERVWKEPNKFMPERFLMSGSSGDGEDVTRMERSFISFGAGRRSCPGMELAKAEIALTLANLVNSFQWCSAVEGQPPDLSPSLNPLLVMKTPLVARVVPRRS